MTKLTPWALLSLLVVLLPANGSTDEAQPLAPPAKAALAQPKYLSEPARLGADETVTSRHFQFADFNGDGLPDLFQLSYGPDRAWVILNQGREGRPFLGAPVRFPSNFSELRGLSLNTTDAWAADFDGDGDLDLVMSTTGAGQVVLVVNDGDRGWPVFEEGKLLVDKPVPGATLAAADADGDGRPDLFVQPAGGGLRLYRNTSDGKTASVGPAAEVRDTAGQPVVASCPSPVDFNGDGALDLVSLVPKGGASIHLGTRDGKGLVFQPAVAAVDEAGKPIPGGNDVGLFDWDGDGTLDLLVLDDSCAIRCHAGMEKGKPVFRSRAVPVHGNTFGRADERYAPTLADFDKDGRSDLVLGGSYDVRCAGSSPLVRAYRNTMPAGPCAFGAGSFVLGPKTEPLFLQPGGYMGSGDPCLADFDGDGRLDLLWSAGSAQTASAMMYSGDDTAPRAFKGPAAKLATLGLENKPLTLHPLAADWNGDGATDLIVGSYGYNLDRLSLLVNQGSSKAPTFDAPVIFTSAGKELKGTYPGTGFPCVCDWDGDGRPDLLVSGHEDPDKYSNATFRWYRNKDGSADLDAPVDIRIGPQGTRVPFVGNPAVGDLDGDGVADLVISRNGFRGHGFLSYGELWLFRGIAADAPDPVRDLSATGSTANSVTLSWTAPAGAAGGEVRCSPQPIDEINWFAARPATRKPTPAGTGAQAFEFDGLEPGALYYFAVCHSGARGGHSGVSNNVRGATRPLVIVSLVQGTSADALALPPYTGCVDVRVPGKDGQGLGVRAGEERWGACQSYLRFDLSPLAGRKIRKAWITLTATGPASTDWTVRCREVLAAWDPKTVSTQTRDGAAAWAGSDYGTSLAEISPHELVGLKRWDATEPVCRRLEAGQTVLSVHLSTFLSRQTFGFADSESKEAAQRPALTVVIEEAGAK